MKIIKKYFLCLTIVFFNIFFNYNCITQEKKLPKTKSQQKFINGKKYSKKDFINEFGKLIIQSEGRLKPIETYSRVQLTLFHGKSKIKNKSENLENKINSNQWLWNLLFDKTSSFDQKIIKIKTKETIDSLSLSSDNEKYFSFNEIRNAFLKRFSELHGIFQKQTAKMSRSEKQIADVYYKIMLYNEIASSLTCLKKDIKITSGIIGSKIKVKKNDSISYFDILKYKKRLSYLIDILEKQKSSLFSDDITSKDTISFINSVNNILQDRNSTSFKIIPPKSTNDENWLSPWDFMILNDPTPLQIKIIHSLTYIIIKYKDENYHSATKKLKEINKDIKDFLKTTKISNSITAEVIYEKIKLISISLYIYILSLLLIIAYFIINHEKILQICFYTLFTGLILHTLGIIMRMYIMMRPPVSTLYESIIFVAFICVLGSLIFSKLKNLEAGIIMGGISGVVLLFISLKYNKEGDSLGMLRAVLDSNFWLSTHVVSITIGYGCSLIVGIMSHIYLMILCFSKNKIGKHDDLIKSIHVTAIIALFFTTMGTILGGIWGDQSWGRFWGWDPKENGALLIVLWLILSLHGKVAGILKPYTYAASLALINICVILAWFGVNLLNVGLHTYGVTENIGKNIIIFCILELLIIGGLTTYIYAKHSKRKNIKKRIKI